MTKETVDISLQLARREKRLRYWQTWLTEARKSMDRKPDEKISSLLNKYRADLAKYAFTEDDTERDNLEEAILSMENELESIFNSKRLMTSGIGIPAVGD
jgi:hypothetical protein